jgi:uncharacterized glyoxalase superfamily protein PhnB
MAPRSGSLRLEADAPRTVDLVSTGWRVVEGSVQMSDAFPILSVEDLAAVVGFYELLGFSRTFVFPEPGDPVFVTLERGRDAIGVATRDPADTTTFSYWVYVDDVDATYMTLTARGATSLASPHAEPWGERVASVRDPAGNVVHVGMATEDKG